MKAKYYRFLYQNTQEGVCHTGSIADAKKQEHFNFIFISGLTVGGANTTENERFSKEDTYALLVLADITPWTVKKAVQIMGQTKVEQVVLPSYDAEEMKTMLAANSEDYSDKEIYFLTNPCEFCKEKEIPKVVTVDGKLTIVSNDWRVMIAAYGNGADTRLVMYHGSENMDKASQDCVMTVKCVDKQETCSNCVDENNLNYEMRSVLYNDFDVCKKHNGSDAKEYVDGHLLLGTVDLKKYLPEIKKEFQNVWTKIRVIAIPNGGNKNEWDKGILDIGTEGYKQYFVSPAAQLDNGEAIREIALAAPNKQLMATSDNYGICCSGYYKDRE